MLRDIKDLGFVEGVDFFAWMWY